MKALPVSYRSLAWYDRNRVQEFAVCNPSHNSTGSTLPGIIKAKCRSLAVDNALNAEQKEGAGKLILDKISARFSIEWSGHNIPNLSHSLQELYEAEAV